MRLLLVILPACLFLEGCSFLFTHGPPSGHEKLDYFDCDADVAGPVADGTWALIDGVFLAAFVSANNDANPIDRVGAAPVAVAAALGAVHVASAVYGVVKITKCADAREHLRQRIAQSAVEKQQIIDELQRQLDAASVKAQQPAAPAPTPNASESDKTQIMGPSPAPVVPPSGTETPRAVGPEGVSK
jgi:hypothetical protein